MSARVDTFYVLDFDRCIGDTAKFHTALMAAIAKLTPVSPANIRQAKHQAEQSGGSFDTASYIMNALISLNSPVSWQEICEAMVAEARGQDMLEPGAAELLQALDDRGARYGILTYGGDAWQRAKIQAANLAHVPHLITSVHSKGKVLAGWRQRDGTFAIPAELAGEESLVAESLLLIDDKAASFAEIPPGVRGIHIVWAGRELLPSQMGELPPGVATVRSMNEAIELLFSLENDDMIDKA